jgi:hypothetical protein
MDNVGIINSSAAVTTYFVITASLTKSLLYWPMEQHALKNVNNCWNTNISFFLETSGGQKSNLYLNVVYFFNTSID